MMKLLEKLSQVQQKLKAPKNQYNDFGKYKYRNCEDILEALKPILNGLCLTITDEIVLIGERYYIKAKATVSDGKDGYSCYAYAREPENKKGQDESQITGSASSYARKYALNGLFLIDDTKDSDATNTHGKEEAAKPPVKTKPVEKKEASDMATTAQIQKIQIIMKEAGIVSREAILSELTKHCGREIASSKDLTKQEAMKLIDKWGTDNAAS